MTAILNILAQLFGQRGKLTIDHHPQVNKSIEKGQSMATVHEHILSAEEAKKLILKGGHVGPICFQGKLDLNGENLSQLPNDITGDVLDISNTQVTELPQRLKLGELVANNTPLTYIPDNLDVLFRLSLEGCARLQKLPENLRVGSIGLENCISLKCLPEGLDVCFLNINGCNALNEWPQKASVRFGHLSAQNCLNLRHLPHWLTHVARLDLSGCPGITTIPEHLKINGWLDVAASGITSLPAEKNIPLRWRGVQISKRIAFDPESITGTEVMAEENTEVRRVMMERMGYERFLEEVNAKVIDRDTDAGGERTLVKVELPEDEPFVAVSVACPSTGRKYVLRVPPNITTAHAASAWLAGFDNPEDYKPAIES